MNQFSTGYYSGRQGAADWYLGRMRRVRETAGAVSLLVLAIVFAAVVLGAAKYASVRQNTYGIGAEQHAPTTQGLIN